LCYPCATLCRSLPDDARARRMYAFSLHDALAILEAEIPSFKEGEILQGRVVLVQDDAAYVDVGWKSDLPVPLNELTREKVSSARDRKSTRLHSSHVKISYAVVCLKKKEHTKQHQT